MSRHRRTRKAKPGDRLRPRHRAAPLLFLLPSLPVSDFLILENRRYVPAMGLLVALTAAVEALLSGIGGRVVSCPVAGVALALVLVLATRSWAYTDAFRDPSSSTAPAVRSSPPLALAHLNRGMFSSWHSGWRARRSTLAGSDADGDPQQPSPDPSRPGSPRSGRDTVSPGDRDHRVGFARGARRISASLVTSQ